MSCSCGNKYHQPGCIEYLQSAPYCSNPCDDPNPCEEHISTDCVIYTGPNVPCYGLVTGMTLTEILDLLFQATYPQCTTTTSTTSTTTTTTAVPTTTSTTSTTTSTTSTTTTTAEPTTTTTSTTSTTTTTTLDPAGCSCYSIENPTGSNEGAVVVICGGTDPLEVSIPANSTVYYCITNGYVPYEQTGNNLIITACGTTCVVDDLCENCGITTTTTTVGP